MNKGKLSQEEKTLLDAVESGEYESYANQITQERT
ncbi:hypothetical protein SAMN05216309_11222 [Nitrosomonas europaea]|nr:hypothetical protein SAMN05216310_13711 [Nitrosomonas europaea]SES97878.1 hypothetical protein SAMN05216309_11222 [Nitrosomonas europaea]